MASLCGGTGSGLGALLLAKLREEYQDRVVTSVSLAPSPLASHVTTEAYNTVLSFDSLIESVDMVQLVDNKALATLATDSLGLHMCTVRDLNQVVASLLTNLSASSRYPPHGNAYTGDMRKLAANLVPFPRLHFLTPGHAESRDKTTNFSELTGKALFANSALSTASSPPPLDAKLLAACAAFRGVLSTAEVDVRLARDHAKVPRLLALTCAQAKRGQSGSVTSLANNTAVRHCLKAYADKHAAMFRRKAFVHAYVAQGMDEMELTSSAEKVTQLADEYAQYEKK